MSKHKRNEDTSLVVQSSNVPSSNPAPPTGLDSVVQQALAEMDKYKATDTKTHETHDGLYYQENKRKNEQVLAFPGGMVAKKKTTITVTIANPTASKEEVMKEKPFVPTQKMTAIMSGTPSQSEVSKARSKGKKRKR